MSSPDRHTETATSSPPRNTTPRRHAAPAWAEMGSKKDEARDTASNLLVTDVRQVQTSHDLKFLRDLGTGSWSTVMEACLPAVPEKLYAVKIISKVKLIREGKAKTAIAEKNALAKLGSGKHPGFLKLYNAFQDPTHLYLVMDAAPGGDLQLLVKEYGSFSTRVARYYAAQIVDAVLWMHAQGILHRDLKPENALLDSDLRIKLADFGCAYIAQNPDDLAPRKSTFVGSAAYVSPELLDKTLKTTSAASDLWAIGCIVFYLVAGTLAFLAPTDYLTFKKIEALDYNFPIGFNEDARDLVERLLVLDPSDRLGVAPKSSPDALRAHPFFASRTASAAKSDSTTSPSQPVPSSAGEPTSSTSDSPSSGENFRTDSTNSTSTSPDTPTIPSTSPTSPPIDWSTLWTCKPPKPETGIRAPTPVDEERSFDSFVADFDRARID